MWWARRSLRRRVPALLLLRRHRRAGGLAAAAVAIAGIAGMAALWWRHDDHRSDGAGGGRAAALTAISLADDWLPQLFSETSDRRQPLRAQLLQLANEQLAGKAHEHARRDRFFELYGVFPSLTVLGRRLLDEPRHRCHDQVDDRALASADDARPSPPAITAVQAHLRCDRLLTGPARPGRLDGATARALGRYRRLHMTPGPGRLDQELRALLLSDSRELDFRALLRTLRERTADAAGLIEDGSASAGSGTVFGRQLDGEEFRRGLARAAATPTGAHAAPDLISPATEAAARALGWTSPEDARRWFAARVTAGDQLRFRLPVQVLAALPPPPAYHRRHMPLRARIDRGDVWLTAPASRRVGGRRPALVLLARDGSREVALARWPTTIGGWQPFEEEDGSLNLRHGESPAGPAVWRDLLAGPAWYPPPGIPVQALLAKSAGGPRARAELIGPGYRAAYGLMALVHEQPRAEALLDHGIRTHGSPSFLSVARGESHGCHRLYNHLAVRLGSFLLRHRLHVRHGAARQRYQRLLLWQEASGEMQALELRSDQRGYRYELAPPIPVTVEPGRVHGSRAAVARAVPLQPAPRPDLASVPRASF